MARLTDDEVQAVRAMLAMDRSAGKAMTLDALDVTREELDALTVHGDAPDAMRAAVSDLLRRATLKAGLGG